MRLSRRKIRYVEKHFRRYSNAKLARALNVDKDLIWKTLKQRDLTRSEAQRARIRRHPDAEPSEYTGQLDVPTDGVKLTRIHFATATLGALAAFVVYFLTLGPTVTGEDSGELVTAAYSLGVPHPPGYPLWCLLGKLFTFIPFGTVAWRVNLMSASLSAGAVFVVCLIIIKLRAHPLAALAGCLAFAFSKEFWEQSVIAEVYALNTFLVALCVLLLFLWYETRKAYVFYAFAFTYGLGLCNHNTMHFLAPLFALFVLAIDREPWRRWKFYVASACFTALALFVHVYLPLRARTDPPVNWGDPSTWEDFWDVIMRKQYSFGFKKNPRTPGRFAVQTWTFLKLYAREFTPWLMWVPVLGVVGLWRKEKGRLAFLLGLAGYIVFGFVLVLNFDLDKQSIWLNNVFWIPAYMVAGVLIGCGVHWLGRVRLRRVRLWPAAALLGAAAVALPLAANYYPNDKSDYYFAHDLGMNIMRILEEDAIYFPSADHATFPVIYLQAVEGLRPDIAIGNKYGYPEKSLYQDMPLEVRRRIRKIPSQREEHMIEDWVIANTARPVYFTKKRDIEKPPGAKMVNYGLVYRVLRAGEELPAGPAWQEYEWHTLDRIDTRGELTAELIVADYHFARGRELLERGRGEEGLADFECAVAIAGEAKETLNNLGSACADHGQFDAAEQFFVRALAIDEDYVLSTGNLAKLRLRLDRPQEALPLCKRLVRLEPRNPEGYKMATDCLVRLGRIDQALNQLEELTKLTPEDPKVFREMGMLLLNYKNDLETAQRYFAQSLRLDPDQPDLVMLVNQSTEPRAALPTAWDAKGLPIPAPPIPLPKLPTIPQPQAAPRPR